MTRAATNRRSGFTLVEILIVIAIIGTLAALLLGAISRVGEVGRKTLASAEISQLETAVAKFKQEFGFAPPTYAVFPTPGIAPVSGSDAEKTARYLQKMFRAYDPLNDDLDPSDPDKDVFTFRGTNINGKTLIGIHSLSWFLAGPDSTGFKVNVPVAPLQDSSSLKSPYYNFMPNRFVNKENASDIISYRDPWGTPYAYFSTGAGKNYSLTNPADIWELPGRPGVYLGPFRVGGSSTSPWAAMGQIQIISAGPDMEFGTFYTGTSRNSEWVPGSGEYSDAGTTGFGADDISNFNGGVPLGTASK